MEQMDLDINVQKAFGNLYRKQCILVAVQNEAGKVLLGAKPYFYPPTISRMLGGGVDEGECVSVAVVREIAEELGVTFNESDFTPLFQLNTHATDEAGKKYNNQTYVYHVKIGNEKYQAGDDVKYILELTLGELHELGSAYEALPDTLWYKGPEGEFNWADYGKMYGPIHKMTADKINRLNLSQSGPKATMGVDIFGKPDEDRNEKNPSTSGIR